MILITKSWTNSGSTNDLLDKTPDMQKVFYAFFLFSTTDEFNSSKSKNIYECNDAIYSTETILPLPSVECKRSEF
jgi:hypothetical protein